MSFFPGRVAPGAACSACSSPATAQSSAAVSSNLQQSGKMGRFKADCCGEVIKKWAAQQQLKLGCLSLHFIYFLNPWWLRLQRTDPRRRRACNNEMFINGLAIICSLLANCFCLFQKLMTQVETSLLTSSAALLKASISYPNSNICSIIYVRSHEDAHCNARGSMLRQCLEKNHFQTASISPQQPQPRAWHWEKF